MSSANRATMPGASALFSDDELPWYLSWWQEHYGREIRDAKEVALPTAYEYLDYMQWMYRHESDPAQDEASEKREDTTLPPSNPTSSTAPANHAVRATRCKHLLHPGHPASAPTTAEPNGSNGGNGNCMAAWCPKCIMRIHVRMVNELWPRWTALGGPWRKVPDGATGEDYAKAKEAFRIRKVDLVNAMEELESIAQLEAAWEAANPDAKISEVMKEQGASSTVDMYHQANTYLGESSKESILPPSAPETPMPTPWKAKRKRLSYSPGTPEDTRHRSYDKYARGCYTYDPKSPHACPDEEGWEDTALRQDWRFNVRQCRLLYCDKDPDEPNVAYRELTDDKSKDRLLASIDTWLATIERESIPSWITILKDTSDIFIAWECDEDDDKEEVGFRNWQKIVTLVDTNLEAFARAVGDIDDEDIAEHQLNLEEEAEREDESSNSLDETSTQISSDSEDSDDEIF
ncbi:hypothetical protein IAQ61_002756 [Plenodomus lingam]|uniref:uncharacterized protein n=1 Tax=Leptosphaeria maculans TaxID=5022 RepID=UPI00332BAF0D|nr:hypothetical protein IAQ61_002756 [Plenodomus lingam]